MGQELQASLMRQAVGFAPIDLFGRPNQVLPGVSATTRTGHDVVQTALLRPEHTASILAAIAVALANGPGTELRALLRHLGVVDRHDDGRHTNLAADGMHRLVLVTDGQRDPLLPGHGADV